jgi:Domain of unknown function (DUF4386)
MNFTNAQNDEMHPRIFTKLQARITGVVYLLYFLIAILAETLKGSKFDVYSNAVNLIAFAFYVAVTILFFYMFKPVSSLISLIAALCSLAGCALGALSLFYLALIKISPLVFFAPYCLLIGLLIFRSTFLPGILGVLMIFAGLGWLAYLSPLGKYMSVYFVVIGIAAEGSLMLWLIVKGINVERGKGQAEANRIKS